MLAFLSNAQHGNYGLLRYFFILFLDPTGEWGIHETSRFTSIF
jgi:hypothetical protein